MAAILGVFVPIISVVAFFTFLIIAVWLGTKRRTQEAFYRAETLRRITETSGEGAKAAIELLREDERLMRIKSREGRKIGGLINIAVGLALMVFLGFQLHGRPVFLVGLIPALIGVAMLVYTYSLATPVE